MTRAVPPALIDAPVLETARLILRAPEVADFDAYAAFYASPRSAGADGPKDRDAAWADFAMGLGHWLLRGYGFYTLVDRQAGVPAGFAGFWKPQGWPETELGWSLYDGFEGRGLAAEAVLCLRDYAHETLGWSPLCSLIAPDNARSIALAERVGARFEREWTTSEDETALLFRHPISMGRAA